MRHLLVCLLVACGGNSTGNRDGGNGDGGGSIKPEELTEALEDALCDAGVACQQFEDRPTCDAANDLLDQTQKSLLAAIADGTVIYDGQAAKRCVDFLAMDDCVFDGFHVDNPCTDVVKGTVGAGGGCYIDQQCASGGRCNQADPSCDDTIACCVGTCVGSTTESPIGGPCDNGTNVCAIDAYCNASKCTALVAGEGSPCNALDACANPMFCHLDFMTGTGTCMKPAASGAMCDRNAALACADLRDYCAVNNTCTRKATPGQSCANNVPCVDYAKCISNSCVADRKLGESCSTAPTSPNCAGTLDCTMGTCQGPGGMTCAL